MRTPFRTRTQKISTSLSASILLMLLCSIKAQDVPAGPQTQVRRKPDSCAPLVIQGRITAIHGAVVTVKTPDAYPGGPGVHAQFVIGGPTFKADISRARILLADGRGIDSLPLAVGDHVLMLLSGPDSGSPNPNIPGNISQTYFATTIERIVQDDKMITH
jgi:hypothetical protein